MPLFICPTCLCVENTATGYFWTEHRDHNESCTGCRPATGIKAKVNKSTGWHGKFPRKKATGEWLISIGYLTDEWACRRTPTADQLVGEALEQGATIENVTGIKWDNLETIPKSIGQSIINWIKQTLKEIT